MSRVRGNGMKKAWGKKGNTNTNTTPNTKANSNSSKPKEDTGTSAKGEQVIDWTPPVPIFYGTALSAAHLNAKLTKGDGKLTFSPAKGDVLGVGKHTLRVDAASTAKFAAASMTVEIEVKPKITWSNPGDITYGTALSDTQLNATVEPTGVTLVYTPALGTALDVGNGILLKVQAQVGENLNAATKEVRINVKKAPTTITWSEPAPVAKDTLLSGTQLNATSSRAGTLVYAPASGTQLTDLKTYWLTVKQEATDKYLSAVHQVRLLVANAQAIAGFTGVADGTAWKTTALSPEAQTVRNNWIADTGKMKTQGQQLMRDLSTKTGEELIDYMDKLVTKTEDRTSQSGTYPNQIWKLPNGLQVRYKSNGDIRNDGIPMFCIEGRTTTGFSTDQSEIAFKLSSSGVPTAKGPGDTIKPNNLSTTDDESFTDGACSATHLFCEPKLDPVIEWTPPAEMEVTSEYSKTQLNAVLTFGDNKLTYTPGKSEKPSKVETGVKLKVTAGKTNRFKQAEKEVTINVVKTKAKIAWKTPADITFGEPLGPTQLNATTIKGATLKYKPGNGSRLKVGDNQTLKAFIEADREFEAVETTVTINVKKADPSINWNDPKDIEYGTLLSETQLNASQRGNGELTYDPPLETQLEVGDGQLLSVSAAETENYNASAKTVKINVVPADPEIDWITPKQIAYGTRLSKTQLNAKQVGDGELTYAPALGEVLSVGNHKLKVTSAATDNYKSSTAECRIKVVKADPVISWPTPKDIVYGTPLSTEQLNATCDPPDMSLVYDPPLGKVLDAGPNQTLKVTVQGNKNYNGKTIQVRINVLKAKHRIEWEPLPIDFGAALTDKQLNARCTTAQSLDYFPDSGYVFAAVGNQLLQVTGAATNNYEETTKEVELSVKPATPTIEWNNPLAIPYGTPLSADQLNATSTSDGKPVYSPALSTILNAGPGQTLKVTFAATQNFLEATHTVQIDVTPAEQEINWPDPEDITYGTPLGGDQLNATKAAILSSTGILSDPGELKYTPGPGTVLNAGLGQTLRVESPASENFKAATKDVEINVLPLTPVIVWDNPPDMQEGDKLTNDQLNAECKNGGPLVYTPPLGTVLPVGDGQTLRVSIESTANSLPATKVVKVNVKPTK